MIPSSITILSLVLTILLGLKFEAPKGWEEVPLGAISMRLAEHKLPRAEGDTEDATVTVHHFGMNMGGSAEANVQRWLGQFEPKDGEPKIEKPKDGDALKITWVEVGGTYVAETRPGSGTRLNKPGWKLIGAVIESSDGFYFVKAVGPKKTIEKNAADIRKYGSSAKPG